MLALTYYKHHLSVLNFCGLGCGVFIRNYLGYLLTSSLGVKGCISIMLFLVAPCPMQTGTYETRPYSTKRWLLNIAGVGSQTGVFTPETSVPDIPISHHTDIPHN